MKKARFHSAVVTGFALALLGACGCGEKTKAPTEISAEQREAARQQHIENSQRERSEK